MKEFNSQGMVSYVKNALKVICFCLQINNKKKRGSKWNFPQPEYKCAEVPQSLNSELTLLFSCCLLFVKNISVPRSRSTKWYMIHYLPSPSGLTSHISINSLGLHVSQNVFRKWLGKIFKFKVFAGNFIPQALIINP